jgi:EmrB/QacA subfamily drug resistance transporter
MLFNIGILVFLMNIDYTAVNLALIPIAEDTDGDLNILQWLLSGYVLIWAAFVVPAGRLADIYGKKESLITGIILFMIGSIVTGVGQNIYVLIAGRLFQGLGAAIFSSPAYGIIFSSVPSQKQGMAMGFIGGSAGLGLAAGPTIAGWIIKDIGWRWLFYINIPLCLLVIAVLLLYAPQEQKHEATAKIDWVSVFLLVLGLGSFVFALNQIEVWGFTNPWLLGIGMAGLSLLLLFIQRDRKQPLQTLPKSLLQNNPFMSTVAASFFSSYNFALILVMMGLYLQNTLRLSSSDAGLCFLAMTLAIGILSPIGGKLADRMDMRIPMILGYGLTFMAFFILSFAQAHSSLFVICFGLFLAGLGLGIGFPSTNTAMFRTLTSGEINTGSAIFTMAMMLGNSISVIASTSLIVLFGRPKLMDLITAARLTLTSEEKNTLIDVINQAEHTPQQLQTFPSDQIPDLLKLIDQAFLHGFKITFWIGMAFCLLSAGIVFKYLKNLKPQEEKPEMIII